LAHNHPSPDIVIIGSGIGGATMAYGLAKSGLRILVLERGQQLADCPEARDTNAIFHKGFFRPQETWLDGAGQPFNPGNYYYVGGNSKFYGAVLIRYRKEDFEDLEHEGGLSPAWPFGYDELEPWYSKAERLYQVRGASGEDPTEPPHSSSYPHPPVPDEPAIAETRRRLEAQGLHPFSLPLGVDLEAWTARAPTPWDAYPDTRTGKMDAETCLNAALAHDNVTLETGAFVERLETDAAGQRIEAVTYRRDGELHRVVPKIVILAAGAVNSAALLLRSASSAAPNGLANSSGQVGRNFMNHNCTAMLAIDPRLRNDSVYQKTLGINDFYLDDGKNGPPLGNVQLLGKISAGILRPNLRWMPETLLKGICRHSVDWYLMSEDLPNPNSRVRLDGDRIVLDWQRSNMAGHQKLVTRMRELFRAAGFPIVLAKPFDRRTPSHQCGTIRMGNDPAQAPLDPYCRAFDVSNLFVVDASFLPTSAAVNPALTIAAQALRVARHILAVDCGNNREKSQHLLKESK